MARQSVEVASDMLAVGTSVFTRIFFEALRWPMSYWQVHPREKLAKICHVWVILYVP